MPAEIIIKGKDKNKIVTGSQASAESLLRRLAEHLSNVYPKHPWHIDMTSDYSVIRIRLYYPNCMNYGYILHTLDVQSDPDLKLVTKAGGELLERLFLSRGKSTGIDPDRLDLSGVEMRRLIDSKKEIKDLTNGF